MEKMGELVGVGNSSQCFLVLNICIFWASLFQRVLQFCHTHLAEEQRIKAERFASGNLSEL